MTTKAATPPHFLTLADIAKRLGVPRYRVVYAVRTLNIQHAAVIGEHQGYNEETVKVVHTWLKRIDATRDVDSSR